MAIPVPRRTTTAAPSDNPHVSNALPQMPAAGRPDLRPVEPPPVRPAPPVDPVLAPAGEPPIERGNRKAMRFMLLWFGVPLAIVILIQVLGLSR